MRIFYFLLFLSLIAINPIGAKEEDEQIVVKLSTENQLMPVYLSPFIDQRSGFDSKYLKQLEQVLQFDLDHNGMTYLVKHSSERDDLCCKGDFESLGLSSSWKASNVYYVVKVRISDQKLDARMLLVNSNAIKSANSIALTGSLAQDRRKIHQLADTIFKALFNSDGVATTKILYTLRTKAPGNKWLSEVWEADYDGANARQVTRGMGYCITPAYIPPKSGFSPGSFMFVSYKTGQSKIYMGSLQEGAAPRRFSLLRGNQMMPAISKQRDKVAFISDYTGNPDLFLHSFNLDSGAVGKPQQIYATHQATQGTPSFSPDGNQVAFVSNKDGSPRIYVMDIPTPGMKLKDIKAKLISKQNRESTAPAWSPDGTKIAYCAMSGGSRQIWVYDCLKGKERQLTQGGGNKENPTWGPNSLHLIFNSTGPDGSELYLINLNQPAATKISAGQGEKRFPSWEPK